MKEQIEFEVDGTKYQVNQFLTSEGVKLLNDMITMVGEPLINLIVELKDEATKGDKDLLQMEIDPKKLTSFIQIISTKLESNDIDALFKRILKGTLLANTSQSCASVYDHHFMGQYKHLFKVVFKSLKAQYKDLFTGLDDIADYAGALKKNIAL